VSGYILSPESRDDLREIRDYLASQGGRRLARYADGMKLSRITIDPGVCTGKPCIRGLRFPVARLLRLLAAGSTRDQIFADYPYLEPEDIDEALQYAALLAEDETIELAR
jgi:uncharacterized protein (DUF433 family)